MPKVTIQLPAVTLELPKSHFPTQEEADRVGGEFLKWLGRFLPSWGWRRFANLKYPDLADSDTLSVGPVDSTLPLQEDEEVTGKQMVSPHHGEQLSDVLRQVAEAGYPEAADRIAAIHQVVVTHRDHNLDAAARFLLPYMRSRNLSWRQTQRKLTLHMENIVHSGFQWIGDEKDWRLRKTIKNDAHGDLVLVLDTDKQGSWLGIVMNRNGSTLRVRVSGSRTKRTVPVSQTLFLLDKVTVHLPGVESGSVGTIKELSVSKGVRVRGRDKKTSKSFSTWVKKYTLLQKHKT